MQDFRSYHSICRDIVTRWVYPLVPDAQLVPGSSYVHTQRYSYRESGVKVSRSAQIGAAVVLSKGAVVGENVVLKRTIVGRDVVIGHNCKITESHIFKGMPPSQSTMLALSAFDALLFVFHLSLQVR